MRTEEQREAMTKAQRLNWARDLIISISQAVRAYTFSDKVLSTEQIRVLEQADDAFWEDLS